MNKKCLNCGKVVPTRTDICDSCGGTDFEPIVEKKKKGKK